LMKSF